jgi:16S rRNA (uracil1498-N3)-methyltransferase
MASHERHASKQTDLERYAVQRGSAAAATATRAARALANVDRFAAPGDEPLATADTLTHNGSFRFDRGLAKRLRMREINATEAFTLRDATGQYFRASLTAYDDTGGSAVAYEQMPASPEPTVDLVLACAVLARQRMHFVVQKATELGARRIVPLLTDHSVQPAGLSAEQPHAWAGHIARAARQCRRSSLPHLLATTTLDAFLASPLFAATDLKLYLDDRTDPLPPLKNPPKRIVLFIGPEGGFSDAERARLAPHAQGWRLGGRILRAETAAVVGLTMTHATWGDFRER